MSFKEEPRRRAQEYVQRYGLSLGDELGFGVHGIVFVAESQPKQGMAALRSAVKAHRQEPDYCRERDAYLRLMEHSIRSIGRCDVPEMLRYDDKLLVIEMTVVSRPFVLDFAGAYLDRSPDFSDEVLADWLEEKQEQFGRHWGEVQSILRALQAYGVFMIDVNPGNISLE